MAVIASATLLYQNADPSVRRALIAVRKVTTGDTIDVSSVPGVGLFSTVYAAAHTCPSNRAQAAALPGVAGTIITFSQAGLANDAVDLLVLGEAPQ